MSSLFLNLLFWPRFRNIRMLDYNWFNTRDFEAVFEEKKSLKTICYLKLL